MPKHQQSSIDRLPEDIQRRFFELLSDPRVNQLGVTARINEVLAGAGYDMRLSKSAVNRYAIRFAEMKQKLAQAKEIARVYASEIGSEPIGETGQLIVQIIQNLVFELSMKMAGGDADVDAKALRDLCAAVEKLEKAASENVKREERIREQEREKARKAAMDAVDQAAKDGGPMTKDRLMAALKEAYGV